MRAEPWEISQRNKRLYKADSLAKQTLLSQAGIYLPVTRRTKYWEELIQTLREKTINKVSISNSGWNLKRKSLADDKASYMGR